MLPEMDGLEVCKVLRRDPATAAIPILMLTAKAAEIVLEFKPAGASFLQDLASFLHRRYGALALPKEPREIAAGRMLPRFRRLVFKSTDMSLARQRAIH